MAITLALDGGTYSVTGADAYRALGVVAGSGSYSITGADAYRVLGTVAGLGSFSINGVDAYRVLGVVASGGEYAITGMEATLIAPQQNKGGWEWLNSLNPPSSTPEEEPEPIERKPKRKRIVVDAAPGQLAPDPVIETGIVQVKPAWDEMIELQRRAEEAEAERKKRLWALARADDDWLMLV